MKHGCEAKVGTNIEKYIVNVWRAADAPGDGEAQRIFKTKKLRQRTRRPKTGPWSEFNPAILLNITLGPHEENTSGGIYYVRGVGRRKIHLVESTMAVVKGKEGWRNGPV